VLGPGGYSGNLLRNLVERKTKYVTAVSPAGHFFVTSGENLPKITCKSLGRNARPAQVPLGADCASHIEPDKTFAWPRSGTKRALLFRCNFFAMGKVISEFLLGAGENRGEVIAHKQFIMGKPILGTTEEWNQWFTNGTFTGFLGTYNSNQFEGIAGSI
jgi:hypothetical protein